MRIPHISKSYLEYSSQKLVKEQGRHFCNISEQKTHFVTTTPVYHYRREDCVQVRSEIILRNSQSVGELLVEGNPRGGTLTASPGGLPSPAVETASLVYPARPIVQQTGRSAKVPRLSPLFI